jgi:hypothetical protein
MTSRRRGIWFDKNYRDTDFMEGAPAMGSYDLIVFDPVHVNGGAKSHMSRDYGHHTAAEIRAFVYEQSRLAYLVARPDALMAFKWNDHDQKLPKILTLMETWWEPLFGQKVSERSKHASRTCWVMLRRL